MAPLAPGNLNATMFSRSLSYIIQQNEFDALFTYQLFFDSSDRIKRFCERSSLIYPLALTVEKLIQILTAERTFIPRFNKFIQSQFKCVVY
jgi:hypothetical protein